MKKGSDFLSLRKQWYTHLNEPTTDNRLSVVVALIIALAIILNIAEVVVASIPEYGVKMKDWYWMSSLVLMIFFALEYFMRMWVAADTPHESKLRTAWQCRLDYALSPMGLVDLFSFLPFIFILLLPSQDVADLRILKLISMARLFKLTRYSSSLNILFRVFQENKEILMAAFMVILALTFVSSAGIYLFEKEVQPEAFGSIPEAMWWALVTLTTVGYGDVTPITAGGKIFGSLVILCGVGVAAMPAGIFASSFVQLMKEQERQRRLDRRANHLSQLVIQNQENLQHSLHLELTRSEQREVDYLIKEYGLSLDQAVGVVMHFRH